MIWILCFQSPRWYICCWLSFTLWVARSSDLNIRYWKGNNYKIRLNTGITFFKRERILIFFSFSTIRCQVLVCSKYLYYTSTKTITGEQEGKWKTSTLPYYTPLGCGGKTLGLWQDFAFGYYNNSSSNLPCFSFID